MQPDENCPAYPGSPCSGILECSFPLPDGTVCELGCGSGGYWISGAGCAALGPVERCEDPSVLPVDGALVELGGTGLDPFVPFGEVAEVRPSGMSEDGFGLFLRIRVTDVDAPDCAELHLSIVSETGATLELVENVRLHCGESLGISPRFPVVLQPDDPPLELDVNARLTGLGSDSVHLRVSLPPDDPEG